MDDGNRDQPADSTEPAGGRLDIVADDRERPGGVIPFLEALPGVRVTVSRLPAGDFLVGRRILFERKRLADFAASLADGRLFRQAFRLAHGHLPGAIILEGTASELAASGMRREALQGALITLSLFLGLPVLRALGPEETARLLYYTGRQLFRAGQGAIPRHGRRPAGKRRAQLFVLQGLPGIGPERARRLIEAFGSVEAVMAADPAELGRVPGIGARLAAGIRRVVGEPAAHYQAELEQGFPGWPGLDWPQADPE